MILYSLSTSLVLLCSLKTQDYVLLLSTFITEYDVLLLWLSLRLSLRLSLFHAVRTSFEYGALYRHAHILTHHLSYIIHVHTQCHNITFLFPEFPLREEELIILPDMYMVYLFQRVNHNFAKVSLRNYTTFIINPTPVNVKIKVSTHKHSRVSMIAKHFRVIHVINGSDMTKI